MRKGRSLKPKAKSSNTLKQQVHLQHDEDAQESTQTYFFRSSLALGKLEESKTRWSTIKELAFIRMESHDKTMTFFLLFSSPFEMAMFAELGKSMHIRAVDFKRNLNKRVATRVTGTHRRGPCRVSCRVDLTLPQLVPVLISRALIRLMRLSGLLN